MPAQLCPVRHATWHCASGLANRLLGSCAEAHRGLARLACVHHARRLVLLASVAALRLPAQSLAGNLGGTIHDPSGTGARNATVIMTSHKSNTIVMTASDGDGNFRFTSLPAGEYEMKVVQRGFEVYRAPQVVLEPGRESSQRGSRWNSPQSWRKWTSCRKGPPRLCQDRKPGENRRGCVSVAKYRPQNFSTRSRQSIPPLPSRDRRQRNSSRGHADGRQTVVPSRHEQPS